MSSTQGRTVVGGAAHSELVPDEPLLQGEDHAVLPADQRLRPTGRRVADVSREHRGAVIDDQNAVSRDGLLALVYAQRRYLERVEHLGETLRAILGGRPDNRRSG